MKRYLLIADFLLFEINVHAINANSELVNEEVLCVILKNVWISPYVSIKQSFQLANRY